MSELEDELVVSSTQVQMARWIKTIKNDKKCMNKESRDATKLNFRSDL
jgi:hypothetical protein